MKMYSFIVELGRLYPELVVNYAFAPNATVLRDLLADELDLGFVTHKPEDDSEFAYSELGHEKLCLVVPATFRIRSFESYRNLGFVGHPDGGYYATRILSHMFPEKFVTIDEFPLRGFVNTLMRIPDIVASGRGFTALPEFACRAYPDQRRIRFFSPQGMIQDTVYCVSKRRRSLPARFELILEQYRIAVASGLA